MWIPFECDLCHFCNVTGRGPIPVNTKDDSTLLCIQQASLDGMLRGKRVRSTSRKEQRGHSGNRLDQQVEEEGSVQRI